MSDSHDNSDNNVFVEIDEFGVANVTLNRPEVRNAFDENVIEKLSNVFDDLGRNDDVLVVVLRGNGKSFCAGGDINWMKRAADYLEDQNRDDALSLANMLNKLYSLPKLTIACVQGAAMGGGFGLVCCCDIVIAEEDTKFSLSEVKLGLIPATIGPYVLAAIGSRYSRRYFQTGERFTAAESRKKGLPLVHEICKEGDMEEVLADILECIKTNGPQAMKAAKQSCLDMSDKVITDDVINSSAASIASIRSTDEAKEGLSAFLEKRKASWARS
jgi:methylglutaconyl-CoA hydratase